MWAIDMNRCVACSQVGKCPEAKQIRKALRNLQDVLENTKRSVQQGPAPTGKIIVMCRR